MVGLRRSAGPSLIGEVASAGPATALDRIRLALVIDGKPLTFTELWGPTPLEDLLGTGDTDAERPK